MTISMGAHGLCFPFVMAEDNANRLPGNFRLKSVFRQHEYIEREIFQEELGKCGFEVVPAANVNEALRDQIAAYLKGRSGRPQWENSQIAC